MGVLLDLLAAETAPEAATEVVVNDWGVLGLVRAHPSLTPVLGRLLTRMLRDPRLPPDRLEAEAPSTRALQQSSVTSPPFQGLLRSFGVRRVELDIRWDARCGRFRVFHLPILDPRSTCDLFTDCLGVVRRWSDAHPSHHPLFLQIEPKDAWDAPTTEQRMTAMEAEILSVFPRELVVTPDEVRAASAS